MMMSFTSIEPFPVEDILNYNYPQTLRQSEYSKDNFPNYSPLEIYDLHIDANRSLKRVVECPSLVDHLSELCDKELSRQFRDGFNFRPNNSYMDPRKSLHSPFYDAASVGRLYWRLVGDTCSRIASKMYIFPNHDMHLDAFKFSFDDPGEYHCHAFLKVARRSANGFPENIQRMYDAPTVSLLQDLHRLYSGFAVWQFLPMTKSSQTILERMHATERFRPQMPHTDCLPHFHSLSKPSDAEDGPCLELIGDSAEIIRVESSPRRDRQRKTTSVTPPRRNRARGARPQTTTSEFRKRLELRLMSDNYRLNCWDYVQHAWTLAAETDATFIIFNCGNYERIGIRHRQSQTLFLSPMIDTMRSKPWYRKVHIGLHFAIVKDLLDRHKQNGPLGHLLRSPYVGGEKHQESDCDDGRQPKRQKTVPLKDGPELVKEQSFSLIKQLLSQLDLCLVNFDYGVLRSPIPSSFMRVGPSCFPNFFDKDFLPPSRKKVYPPGSYFSMTLGEAVTQGAIGVVHTGTVELLTESGSKISEFPIAIKMSFKKRHQIYLREEFEIYRHLAQFQEVEGVLFPYGLFEDMDTGILALIMDNGGISLCAREYEKKNEYSNQVEVSPQERESLLRALESIHKAGVYHGDIRSENIVVDGAGHAFIIDFDRAQTGLDEDDDWETEKKAMRDLVQGQYRDGNYYMGRPESLM